jgi:hypothetical protein
MGNDTKQFVATEDSCVYFYDRSHKCYRKVCDILSFRDLPVSVQRQIRAYREEALEALKMPLEAEE